MCLVWIAEQKAISLYSVYRLVLLSQVAQWLRYCATNRKVAGLIPDGVMGIFH
jgi:hypothetical protein